MYLRNTPLHLIATLLLAAGTLLAACSDEGEGEGADTGGDDAADVSDTQEIDDAPEDSSEDSTEDVAVELPRTLTSENRSARVQYPRSYDAARAYPLIVMLHGYMANSSMQELIFNLGSRVDRFEFVLVLPEGTEDAAGNQFWNATEGCCDFGGTNVDDVAHLTGLVDAAESAFNISTVHFVGHSNGGYMSYRMACEIPERIDSIVSLAGLTFQDERDCVGTDSVSVLHIHGTADETITYEPGPRGPGAEESLARWADKARCDSEPVPVGTRDTVPRAEGDEAEVFRYNNCVDERMELWRLNEVGHIPVFNNDALDAMVEFLLVP